jgi:hypothetical protein
MSGIGAAAGLLKNRNRLHLSGARVKSLTTQDFWAAPPAAAEVPVFCLEDEIASHRANVLIIDVQGGEIELLDGADLASIRLIIMKTSDPADGVTGSMIRRLVRQGFDIDRDLLRRGIAVLVRETNGRWKGILRRRLRWARKTAAQIAQFFRPSLLKPARTGSPKTKSASAKKRRQRKKREKAPAALNSS